MTVKNYVKVSKLIASDSDIDEELCCLGCNYKA